MFRIHRAECGGPVRRRETETLSAPFNHRRRKPDFWDDIYFESQFMAAYSADLARPDRSTPGARTCCFRELTTLPTELARTFAGLSATNEAIL